MGPASYGPTRPGILVAVGIISIVVGSLGILSGCGGIFTAIFMTSMPRAMAAVAAANQANAGAGYTIPAQMEQTQRQIVTTAMSQRQALTTKRQELLDLLLQRAGDDMFPFTGQNITPASVAGSITNAGQFPDAGGNTDFFVLANGRVEIGDEFAVFSPAGAGQSVRVAASELVATPPTATPMPAPATVAFAAGPIPTDGAVTYAITSVVGILLAIYLLISGIVVLRSTRRGRGLHLTYAVLKVPAAIVTGVAYMKMMMQANAAMAPAGVVAPAVGMGVLMALWIAIACLYPIALLIVMNTHTVKDYYRNAPAS